MRPILAAFAAGLLLLFNIGQCPATGGAETALLFVGNSHTYFNDLPGLVTGLADAARHPVRVDQSTPGGYTLAAHAENPTTLAKIAKGPWDHVFLQEHSLYPVIEYHRDHSFFPAARSLDSLIAASGSGTSFFMTWGWEFGGEHCVGGYCCPDYPDYFAMQVDVSKAYRRIATELDAHLVPVGEFWALALQADPDAPLWTGDHYHPDLEGSYLAACVFFARIFDESPVGLDFHGGIDPRRARFYQEIASQAVTGNLGAGPDPGLKPELLPNRPNPFYRQTVLSFTLPAPALVSLEFFDVSGRRIDAQSLGLYGAGRHRAVWRAPAVPVGVYLCRLRAGGHSDTRKLMLLH